MEGRTVFLWRWNGCTLSNKTHQILSHRCAIHINVWCACCLNSHQIKRRNHMYSNTTYRLQCLIVNWGGVELAHLLNSKSSFSKMRIGPVELRMMRGWPLNRQNTVPDNAVPRKLSITPWYIEEREKGGQGEKQGRGESRERAMERENEERQTERSGCECVRERQYEPAIFQSDRQSANHQQQPARALILNGFGMCWAEQMDLVQSLFPSLTHIYHLEWVSYHIIFWGHVPY